MSFTFYELQPLVAHGASYLDDVVPDWFTRINPDELNMDSCYTCLLGQLYGEFTEGRAELAIPNGDGYKYGFDLARGGPESTAAIRGGYVLLARLWQIEIQSRLSQCGSA